MKNVEASPFPRERGLLWLQDKDRHRAFAVFNGVVDGTINIRRCDKHNWDHLRQYDIPQPVNRYINQAEFGGVVETGYHKLDHALVTTLVERWRPETHTFHFPVGEATVTLQDVQVLLGLPIDAPVVAGTWMNKTSSQWAAVCRDQLGFTPALPDLKEGRIKIRSFVSHLNDYLPNNEVAYQPRARIYILCLIGGHLFPDLSSLDVSLNYVYDLEDLSVVGRKSWGNAVLCCLYRNLCNAAGDCNAKGISGPLLLLQFWAWVRIPWIAPRIVYGDYYRFQHCYAARWDYNLSHTDTPAHVLVTNRSLFTALRPEEFIWRPYEEVVGQLPRYCREGQHICSYNSWLIFWNMVEPHPVHRVARQLGFYQLVPEPHLYLTPDDHRKFHKTKKSGGRDVNWATKHQTFIAEWNTRRGNLFNGVHVATTTPGTAPDYMQWYFNRTVLFITDPGNHYQDWGGPTQAYVEGFRHIHERARQTMDSQADRSSQAGGSSQVFQEFQQIPQYMMNFGGDMDRMNYGSQQFQFNFAAPDYYPQPPDNQLQTYHQNPPDYDPEFAPGFEQPTSNARTFYESGPSVYDSGPTGNATNIGSSLVDDIFETPMTPYQNMYDGTSSFVSINQYNEYGGRRIDLSPIQMTNLSNLSTSQLSPDFNEGYTELGSEQEHDQPEHQHQHHGGPQRQRRPGQRVIRPPRCGTGGHM